MNREEIIRMAQEASLICVSEPVTPWIEDTDLTPHILRFAALVLANTPPQSSMAWQEGFEAGAAAERERILKQIAVLHDTLSLSADPGTLKARGQE